MQKLDNNTKAQFINEIIESFEDFLDEKNIIISNPEKSQDPDASNIYGTDYGDIQSRIEETLSDWHLTK